MIEIYLKLSSVGTIDYTGGGINKTFLKHVPLKSEAHRFKNRRVVHNDYLFYLNCLTNDWFSCSRGSDYWIQKWLTN